MDEQLTELTTLVDREQMRLVKPEDVAKVLYLRDYCVSDHHLYPYDYVNIEAAKKHITGKLRKREE